LDTVEEFDAFISDQLKSFVSNTLNGYKDSSGTSLPVQYRDIAAHVKKFEAWKEHLNVFMDRCAISLYKEFLELITLKITSMFLIYFFFFGFSTYIGSRG
jgi:hypothetical protein